MWGDDFAAVTAPGGHGAPLTQIGGPVSAEHGIGRENCNGSPTAATRRIALMRLVKRSLDPHNTLNPGWLVNGDAD
jgi:FAD/FMN-containing dehydrogenase